MLIARKRLEQDPKDCKALNTRASVTMDWARWRWPGPIWSMPSLCAV